MHGTIGRHTCGQSSRARSARKQSRRSKEWSGDARLRQESADLSHMQGPNESSEGKGGGLCKCSIQQIRADLADPVRSTPRSKELRKAHLKQPEQVIQNDEVCLRR